MRSEIALLIRESKSKTYYKSFDGNLCGYGGFQYEVGKTYITNTDDTFRWFHFCPKAKLAIRYSNSKDTRVCEIKRVGDKISKYDDQRTSNGIEIIREIREQELYEKLEEEKCPLLTILMKLRPSFEYLMKRKNEIHGMQMKAEIINRADLTTSQKKELLNKRWHKEIERNEKSRRLLGM